MTLPRCKKGTRRNRKTGLCESHINLQPNKPPLKRCPNGSRRNPKTGECVKTKPAGKTLLDYFTVSKIGKGKKQKTLKVR